MIDKKKKRNKKYLPILTLYSNEVLNDSKLKRLLVIRIRIRICILVRILILCFVCYLDMLDN